MWFRASADARTPARPTAAKHRTHVAGSRMLKLAIVRWRAAGAASTLTRDRQLVVDPFEERMKIGIIGMGYVGLPLGVALAEAGHEVIGLDTDQRRIAAIQSGDSYIEDVSSDRLEALD